ncbi:hypothetical protein [Candidatus Erwinia haradaeae]|nr:hypothetical protein [Candidatus Erwinia haradaeae]
MYKVTMNQQRFGSHFIKGEAIIAKMLSLNKREIIKRTVVFAKPIY